MDGMLHPTLVSMLNITANIVCSSLPLWNKNSHNMLMSV